MVTVSDNLSKVVPGQNWLPLLGQMVRDSFSETFFKSSQMIMLERYKEREVQKIAQTLYENKDSYSAIAHLQDLEANNQQKAIQAFDSGRLPDDTSGSIL